MTVLSLPRVAVQPDFDAILLESRISALPSTFWLSLYPRTQLASPPVHASVSVLPGATARLAASDGIECTLLGPNKLRVSSPSLEDPIVVTGPTATASFGGNITAIHIAPSRSHAVVGGDDSRIGVYSTSNLTRTSAVFNGHRGDITTANLLTTATDLTAKIWDAATGENPVTLGRADPKAGHHTRPITHTQFVERGRNIVTGARDGRVLLWEVSQAVVLRDLFAGSKLHDAFSGRMGGIAGLCVGDFGSPAGSPSPQLEPMEFGTSGKLCLAANEDGTIAAVDLQAGGSETPLFVVKDTGNNTKLTAMACDFQRGVFVVGDSGGLIRSFDFRNTATPLLSLKRNNAAILNLETFSNSSGRMCLLFANEEGSCANVEIDSNAKVFLRTEYVGTDIEPLNGLCAYEKTTMVGGREGIIRLYED
ncbi:Proteasomal ATPase-associated factor 1 [Entophlyctis sp. JEL0112]|nr:Proteasomal ATPase-associated factor 1 [Entophlyctis sp. JEL0112]